MIPDTTGRRHVKGEGREAGLPGAEAPGRLRITEDDYRRLHPKLVARFRALGAFVEEARDLTQETLLRAHKCLDTFEGRSQLDTWAVSIAKRVWLQYCRDQCREKRKADEVPLETVQEEAGQSRSGPGIEEEMVTRDLLAQATRAIRRLPEAMQQALTLHVQGFKYRKIAVLLGVSENRVSSLIHQAREKLRREVREQPADSTP